MVRGDRAETDVTQRFLDAGLVIFGKTNTPEFGAKGVTEPELWGAARNPWRTAHTPGGSSGGSGAAVAAGIVPAAGANDGGGSIRIPAACNGLVGLKTSRGVGPYGPQTGEVMFGMVTQGVVSRTVRDSAALLDAMVAHRVPRIVYASSNHAVGRTPRAAGELTDQALPRPDTYYGVAKVAAEALLQTVQGGLEVVAGGEGRKVRDRGLGRLSGAVLPDLQLGQDL